jgi:hypothetical protein
VSVRIGALLGGDGSFGVVEAVKVDEVLVDVGGWVGEAVEGEGR